MKKTQAMIEKVIIVAAIAAALLVMQVWFRWSLSGRLKVASDSTLGEERFDPSGNFSEASTQSGGIGYAVRTVSGAGAGESLAHYRNRQWGQYNKTLASLGKTAVCYGTDGKTTVSDCSSVDAKYVCSGSNKPLDNASECMMMGEGDYDYYSVVCQEVGPDGRCQAAVGMPLSGSGTRPAMNSSTMTTSETQMEFK